MFTGSTKMYLSAIVQMSIGNKDKNKEQFKQTGTRDRRSLLIQAFLRSKHAQLFSKLWQCATFRDTVGILCASWRRDRPPCSRLLELSMREREGG